MPQTTSIVQGQQAAVRVTGAIAGAASRSGVSFDYLYNQARIESGLNPAARARTSSASGLFQFTRQTWLSTLKAHGAENGLGWAAAAIERRANGNYHINDPAARDAILQLRDEPEAASSMAAAFASDNEALLGSALNRPIEPVDLYLAHFLGPAGAKRFLQAHRDSPQAAAAVLFPEAASTNRSIFYEAGGSPRSFDAIRSGFAARLGGSIPAQPAFAIVQNGRTVSHRATGGRDFAGIDTIRPIEPMPQRLSLDFARAAYQRLSQMDGAPAA